MEVIEVSVGGHQGASKDARGGSDPEVILAHRSRGLKDLFAKLIDLGIRGKNFRAVDIDSFNLIKSCSVA